MSDKQEVATRKSDEVARAEREPARVKVPA